MKPKAPAWPTKVTRELYWCHLENGSIKQVTGTPNSSRMAKYNSALICVLPWRTEFSDAGLMPNFLVRVVCWIWLSFKYCKIRCDVSISSPFPYFIYFMTYFIYRNNSKQSYSLILIKSILLLFLNIYAHAAFHLHGEVIIKDGDFFMSWLERGSSNLVNLMSCFSIKDLRSLIRVSVSCRFTSSCEAASFCSLSLKISSAKFSRWLVHSRSFFFSSSRRAWCHPGKACRSVLRL